METPLQSEKVREKAHQLCREYLQVGPLDSFDARILFLPGFLEAGWREAAGDPADQRRALQPGLLCWIASRSRQGRAGAALHSTQVLLQSWLNMLMPPFIFYFRLFGELSQTPVHQYRMMPLDNDNR